MERDNNRFYVEFLATLDIRPSPQESRPSWMPDLSALNISEPDPPSFEMAISTNTEDLTQSSRSRASSPSSTAATVGHGSDDDEAESSHIPPPLPMNLLSVFPAFVPQAVDDLERSMAVENVKLVHATRRLINVRRAYRRVQSYRVGKSTGSAEKRREIQQYRRRFHEANEDYIRQCEVVAEINSQQAQLFDLERRQEEGFREDPEREREVMSEAHYSEGIGDTPYTLGPGLHVDQL